MTVGSQQPEDWVDGFLFVGNHLALDFLNTKPILEGTPRELLPNASALVRWLAASGIVKTEKDRELVRAWSHTARAERFVRKLVAFRERLRAAVLRLESGLAPGDSFLAEMNMLLGIYPQRSILTKRGSKVSLNRSFEPRKSEDTWIPILAATTELLSTLEPSRIRKCESESCVIHFYDTSKRGSRRWCSMNICGNRLKVAAYQRRQRLAD
jgi:predicted RNA-binding Zn ribbon-like protein